METITLDKERHLRLTMFGMKRFAELTGKDILKGIKIEELSTSDWATLIWACLIHEDRELKIDQVLEMIDAGNMFDILSATTKALSGGFPKKKADAPLAQTSL